MNSRFDGKEMIEKIDKGAKFSFDKTFDFIKDAVTAVPYSGNSAIRCAGIAWTIMYKSQGREGIIKMASLLEEQAKKEAKISAYNLYCDVPAHIPEEWENSGRNIQEESNCFVTDATRRILENWGYGLFGGPWHEFIEEGSWYPEFFLWDLFPQKKDRELYKALLPFYEVRELA